MAHLEDVTADDLRQPLAETENKIVTQQVMLAINYKDIPVSSIYSHLSKIQISER